METAGERIKFLRERRKLSQTQLATKAGISRNHLWRIEKGDRPKVGADVLARIASALGVAVEDLLEDQGSRTTVVVEWEELPPEVEDLARRVSALPADRRARVVGLAEEFLALLEEEPVEASLSEMQREMLAYFDELNETNQEIALARLREILGEGPAQSDERRGARGTA
jgi:transcriptional regulator with XRE-family HTH domain